ncbi:MAG: thioredoxin-like domain-containing protein [Bacteroidota bacterium]
MKYLAALLLIFSLFISPAQALALAEDKLVPSIKPSQEEIIPQHIQKWLDNKTASKKGKSNQKTFFKRDSIRIVGYIKGYPKAASFASGIIYHSNDIVGDDLPTTVRIFEDGRFECSMLGLHPITSNIIFNDQRIGFYAEPGITTGIVLNWQDFTNAANNGNYKFKDVSYLGANKHINVGLASIEFTKPNYSALEESRKKQKPDDFKKAQVLNWANARRAADSLMLSKRTPLEIKNIKVNQIDLMYATYLFDYDLSRDYYQKQEPNNEILNMPLPDDYFDFINKVDLNNPALLICDDFSVFINRYEYSPLVDMMIIYGPKNYNGYQKMDSIYLAKNKKTNLVYDIAKLRSLKTSLGYSHYKKATFAQEFSELSRTITEPVLIAELSRVYDKYKVGKVAYELPNTAAANVFKKLINPLKGKILLIDFWAEWCSPCRAGIERSLALRTKYKDNPDFDFVFVTDSKGTGDSFYQDYIKKNLMVNTHRVTPDEYLALRELFKFNGIPRYVLVDADGKIRDDNFESYELQTEFAKYFPEKFKADYWK